MDGVRVVSRLLHRAQTLLSGSIQASPRLFRDRTRSAKCISRKIGELAVRQSQKRAADARVPLYRRALRIARAAMRQGRQVRALLAETRGMHAERLRAELDRVQPLVEQVMQQTERRVLQGEQVPATKKILSLFEPETALIRRGKAGQPTKFGAKVILDEVKGGLVTRYQVLSGNPSDVPHLVPSGAQHAVRFGQPPTLVVADRSFWSGEDDQAVRALGVRRIGIPRRGGKQPSHERERLLRRAHRFRTGIEGRISVLRRGFGLDRCRYHGRTGMERWIGFGILAYDLRALSHALAQQRTA